MFIRALVCLIVFLLPSQLGIHFWPAFSRVVGIRLDYLSPTLYFLDILLLIFILSSFRPLLSLLKKHSRIIFIILLFICLNTCFAISPLNTLFWWLRFGLYLLFFLSLRLHKITWSQIEKPLLFSTLLIVSVSLIQTLRQSSIDGPLYWLGERHFTHQTPGLARLNLFGLDFVRAPSTFSHPNSFAGYLLVVLFMFLRFGRHSWYSFIPLLGIILSLSKNALVASLLLFTGASPYLILCLSFLSTILQSFLPLLSVSWRSLSDRSFYFSYLPQIVKSKFFFGAGYGNFIPALASILPGSFLSYDKLQPIHNLYFLFFSETGFLGVFSLFIMIRQKLFAFLKTHPNILYLVALLLFTGTFDHYLWTLPQNKLIALLALALMF